MMSPMPLINLLRVDSMAGGRRYGRATYEHEVSAWPAGGHAMGSELHTVGSSGGAIPQQSSSLVAAFPIPGVGIPLGEPRSLLPGSRGQNPQGRIAALGKMGANPPLAVPSAGPHMPIEAGSHSLKLRRAPDVMVRNVLEPPDECEAQEDKTFLGWTKTFEGLHPFDRDLACNQAFAKAKLDQDATILTAKLSLVGFCRKRICPKVKFLVPPYKRSLVCNPFIGDVAGGQLAWGKATIDRVTTRAMPFVPSGTPVPVALPTLPVPVIPLGGAGEAVGIPTLTVPSQMAGPALAWRCTQSITMLPFKIRIECHCESEPGVFENDREVRDGPLVG